MHRSLLTLCALLFPAALVVACGSSTSNTGGSGGMMSTSSTSTSSSSSTTTSSSSSTTTSSGMGGAGDACTDMADSMALAMNKDSVGGDVLSCTLANTGNQSAISMCLQMKIGLTPACANCFAADGDCGAMNCLAMCAGGSSSPGCEMCLAQFCNNAFMQCSGISGQQPDGGSGGGSGTGGGDGG